MNPTPILAPFMSRTVTGIRLTPADAWAAFIGENVSVLDFFEQHRGYTLRGYVKWLLKDTLNESDCDAVGDLVVAYARIAEVR